MIDPNSPNYQPYIEECKKLGDWHMEEIRKLCEIQKSEQFRGMDDPRRLHLDREYGHCLKELQIKYGYREKLP